MNAALERLVALSSQHGLPWDDVWLPSIERIMALLLRFNRRTNLVGDASAASVVDDHLIEALAAIEVANRSRPEVPARVIDVGAGAGLEGLMMALAWPDCRLLAVEPRRRRADFIELAADAAGVGQRTEVMRQDLASLRLESVHVVTSRAVFEPARWVALGSPLVAPGGVLLLHGDERAPLGPSDTAGNEWPSHLRCRVPGTAGHEVHAWRRPMAPPAKRR